MTTGCHGLSRSSGCTAILQKCLTILQLVILVKVKKNIYAEHINFNKETQIVTMDHIFLSESYEIFMPLMACVRGIEKFITPGENNFALIYYYWWGSETAIALEFDANGSKITANPKAENLTIADAFFDEHGEALAEELYNKQGFI